jgi:hypothetical protein
MMSRAATRSRRSFSGVVRFSLVLVACALSTSSVQAQAERSRRNQAPLTIVVAKGLGKVRTPLPSRRRTPHELAVPALETGVVKTAIKAATGKDLAPKDGSAVLLTNKDANVMGTGDIGLAYIYVSGLVEANPGSDSFSLYVPMKEPELNATRFGLVFEALAAGAYAVEIVVAPSFATELECALPDGTSRTQSLPNSSPQHLMFLIESAKGVQNITCSLAHDSNLKLSLFWVKIAPWQ